MARATRLALQRRLVPHRRRFHQLSLHTQSARRSRPGLQSRANTSRATPTSSGSWNWPPSGASSACPRSTPPPGSPSLTPSPPSPPCCGGSSAYPRCATGGLVGWMALGLLCSSATFAVWTSGGGLETRQFTFFITAAVVCLSLYTNSRRGLLVASLSLAAAALTRPEGLMLAACCFGWFAVQRLVRERKNQRPSDSGYDWSAGRAVSRRWSQPTFFSATPTTASGCPTPTTPSTSGPGTSRASATLQQPRWRQGSISCCRWRSWRCAHAGSMASRWHVRPGAALCRRPHGLSAADWRRPLRVSPPRLLLASVGSPCSRRHRSARLRDFHRPAKVPTSAALDGQWEALHDCALPARALLRQRDSGILVYSRGFWDTRAGPVRAYAELNDQKNAGWLLAAPGMPVLVAISNEMRRLSASHWSADASVRTADFANLHTRTWETIRRDGA